MAWVAATDPCAGVSLTITRFEKSALKIEMIDRRSVLSSSVENYIIIVFCSSAIIENLEDLVYGIGVQLQGIQSPKMSGIPHNLSREKLKRPQEHCAKFSLRRDWLNQMDRSGVFIF